MDNKPCSHFIKVGEMFFNPRFIKTAEITPEKADITVRSTRDEYDDDYSYHSKKNQIEYQQIHNFLERCSQ